MRSRTSRSSSIDLANPVERSHPCNRDRIAWWKCLPGLSGGAKLHDLMSLPGDFSRGNHGTLVSFNQGPTSGWNAGGLLFDGVNDYVATPNLGNLASVGNGSLTLLAQVATKSGAIQSFIRRDNSFNQANESFRRLIALRFNESGAPGRPEIVIYDGNSIPRATSTLSYNDGLIHEFVGVWNSVAKTLALYVDGNLVASATDTTNGIVNTANEPWCLGRTNTIDTVEPEYFSGSFYEASISGRALNAAEIKAGFDLSRSNYPGILRRIGPRPAVFAMGSAAASGTAIFAMGHSFGEVGGQAFFASGRGI